MRSKHLRDYGKLSLPSLTTRTGTLKNFLSADEFKKGVQTLNDEGRFNTETNFRLKLRKIFITMNEELGSNSNKESINKLNGSQEEQGESIDERKILLYDKHLINRQKAAVNICKSIVDDVKQHFGYNEQEEESSKSDKNSEESDGGKALDVEKILKKTTHCNSLSEKLDKITEISQKFRHKPSIHEPKKKFNYKNELMPGEIEETLSHESNIHRISKSKEKNPREDPLQQIGDMNDLFPNLSWYYNKHQNVYENNALKIIKMPGLENAQRCHDILIGKIEITSPMTQKLGRQKKNLVLVNKSCLCMPNLRIDSFLTIYIAYYYSSWRTLTKVDFSNNPIGDKPIAFLVYTLNSFAENLEYLDISYTKSEGFTAKALLEMIQNPFTKLTTLKIEGNMIKDEGFCVLSIGLLSNNSLQVLNAADNDIEIAGGVALSKVIRINRNLKAINISRSKVFGNVLREICRALIVNTKIQSFVMNSCGLDDNDAKEIGHMLNGNEGLQQLSLTSNKFTHRGLEYLKYGLKKNRHLVHLALSGNEKIRLSSLESLKESVPKNVEIDISKEDDFFRSPEAKKYKLIGLIR
ncbi:hypothetical protein SteCoe_29515 [Stentor coeruleus]|uniref:Uncharacterized protein n=1 Tax=Stentor coeruleus TaxID=5963 RepID=A0A1R2B5S3_9CILI|nr:hypothetical protein SteCoe_29515 [Stentor coeruleus]